MTLGSVGSKSFMRCLTLLPRTDAAGTDGYVSLKRAAQLMRVSFARALAMIRTRELPAKLSPRNQWFVLLSAARAKRRELDRERRIVGEQQAA